MVHGLNRRLVSNLGGFHVHNKEKISNLLAGLSEPLQGHFNYLDRFSTLGRVMSD